MSNRPKFQIHSQVRQADRAAEAGDKASAHAIFAALVTDFPDNKRAVEAAANGLARLGALDDAIRILDDAMAQMGESPVLLRNLAAHLVAGRRWPAAADTFKRIAQVYPNDITILVEWGRIAEAAGRTPDAKEAFQRALAVDPGSSEAMLSLAGILMVEESFQEAEELLRTGIKQNPRLAEARLKLSSLLLKRDRNMDALSAADAAVALDRNAADGHCARGIVLLAMDQRVLAALAFRRALAIEPKHREARLQLRNLRRGEAPKSLPAVEPPATPWAGVLITDHALGRKIQFEEQRPGQNLKLGFSFRRKVFVRAAAVLRSAVPDGHQLQSLLDLKCGSGLFAALAANSFDIQRAVGIGASITEQREARGKGIFEEIIGENSLDVLERIEGQFDLIAALDFFTTTGPLDGTFQKIADRLTTRGMIIYSIDLTFDDDWTQASPRRYAHSLDYIHRLAKANNLTPIAGEEIATRTEYSKTIKGHLGLLARA